MLEPASVLVGLSIGVGTMLSFFWRELGRAERRERRLHAIRALRKEKDDTAARIVQAHALLNGHRRET